MLPLKMKLACKQVQHRHTLENLNCNLKCLQHSSFRAET